MPEYAVPDVVQQLGAESREKIISTEIRQRYYDFSHHQNDQDQNECFHVVRN